MGVRVQAIVEQEVFKEKVVAENPRGLPGAVGVKRVLVTGANGFVGLNTCRVLREGGFVVRAAVRRADRLPARLSEDEIALTGDIGPGTDWGPVLEGVSA